MFTREQKRQIIRDPLPYPKLAEKYGCHIDTIRKIIRTREVMK